MGTIRRAKVNPYFCPDLSESNRGINPTIRLE